LIAGAIGRIAAAQARAGNVLAAEGIRPLYVRRPDVELARETRGRVPEPAVPATHDGRLDD
jgi:hypothetical protein